jgi:hypothetical protein
VKPEKCKAIKQQAGQRRIVNLINGMAENISPFSLWNEEIHLIDRVFWFLLDYMLWGTSLCPSSSSLISLAHENLLFYIKIPLDREIP